MLKLFSRMLLGAFALAAAVAPAAAQSDYPRRQITLIVPFAAGGPTDIVARIVGEHMARTLGQPVIIENIVGAGGTTASTRAMRAQPDGYTIIMGHMGTHAASVALYPEPCLQARCRLRADRPRGRHAGADPGAEGLSAQGSQGIRHLREGQRRQAEHGACRRRFGVVHHLPAAQLDPGREADLGALQRHRTGADRPDRRPGRLHVRPDRQRGAAGARPARSRPMPSAPRAATRRCRTCRPARKPGCRSSRRRPGTRCSRRRTRRSRSSTSSPMRSTRRSPTKACASVCSTSAASFRTRMQRGQQALARARQERDRALDADHQVGRPAELISPARFENLPGGATLAPPLFLSARHDRAPPSIHRRRTRCIAEGEGLKSMPDSAASTARLAACCSTTS